MVRVKEQMARSVEGVGGSARRRGRREAHSHGVPGARGRGRGGSEERARRRKTTLQGRRMAVVGDPAG